jgi:hypothetical protein
MKNKYFGDINDYKKYGLLRLLSNNGNNKIAVCWMLTADDQQTDGKLIGYLKYPGKWKKYDSQLFDLLQPCLDDPSKRNVSRAAKFNIIPGAKYQTQLLTDNAAERECYFQEFMTIAQTCDLSFFDPDNGLEVKSKSIGRRNSCKYLYWHELKQVWAEGQSLLIYQHFPRIEHQKFIETLIDKACSELNVSDVITYRTNSVVFLLVPQMRLKAYYLQQSQFVKQIWDGQIQYGIIGDKSNGKQP